MNTKFTDLILLVGTNPLPNLVIAKYFINKNPFLKKIWLVSSKNTGDFGNCLKKAIKKTKPGLEINVFAINNERTGKDIESDINKYIIDNLSEESILHLNYTGGTKPMVVHTYRTLERKLPCRVSFSYLNAEEFSIIDDETGIIATDLRKEILVDFPELIELHGFEKQNDEHDKFDSSELIEVFKGLILNNKLMTDFYNKDNQGCYDRKRFELEKNGIPQLVEKYDDLRAEVIENFIPNETFMEINQAMHDDYRLFSPEGKLSRISNNKFKFSLQLLDGKWLEHYIFNVLQKLFNTDDFYFKKSANIKKDEHKFEIDLVLIKGYQLFGFSCTTSNIKGLAKAKGFEIIQRTRQIGGGESRALLFTTLSDKNVKDLEDGLKMDTGSGKKPILVLGLDDLKPENLQEKVKKFVFDEE